MTAVEPAMCEERATVPSAEVEKHPVQTSSSPVAPAPAGNPHDEPSAEWGWHGTLPKGALLGGLFVTLVLFGMLIGNQRGHVEDFYLVIAGLIMAFLLITAIRKRRRARR